MSLFPPVALERIGIGDANRLLVEWRHELGACDRPFRVDGWALELAGEPIAVAVSASTVSATCAGRQRNQLVELARIARHPAHPWVLRVMLRLWREVAARAWCWPPAAAVSYALPGRTGDLYRFDGWRRVGEVRPSGGGGTWSASPAVNDIANGRKVLWVFDYAEPASS